MLLLSQTIGRTAGPDHITQPRVHDQLQPKTATGLFELLNYDFPANYYRQDTRRIITIRSSAIAGRPCDAKACQG